MPQFNCMAWPRRQRCHLSLERPNFISRMPLFRSPGCRLAIGSRNAGCRGRGAGRAHVCRGHRAPPRATTGTYPAFSLPVKNRLVPAACAKRRRGLAPIPDLSQPTVREMGAEFVMYRRCITRRRGRNALPHFPRRTPPRPAHPPSPAAVVSSVTFIIRSAFARPAPLRLSRGLSQPQNAAKLCCPATRCVFPAPPLFSLAGLGALCPGRRRCGPAARGWPHRHDGPAACRVGGRRESRPAEQGEGKFAVMKMAENVSLLNNLLCLLVAAAVGGLCMHEDPGHVGMRLGWAWRGGVPVKAFYLAGRAGRRLGART